MLEASDIARVRRESLRWLILRAMYNSCPLDLNEKVMVVIAQSVYPDASPLEIRRELDYLATRELAAVEKKPSGEWWGKLTRHGTDIVEYTVDCQPGIARPSKYW